MTECCSSIWGKDYLYNLQVVEAHYSLYNLKPPMNLGGFSNAQFTAIWKRPKYSEQDTPKASQSCITWGLRRNGTENRVKPLAELLLTLIP